MSRDDIIGDRLRDEYAACNVVYRCQPWNVIASCHAAPNDIMVVSWDPESDECTILHVHNSAPGCALETKRPHARDMGVR